MGRKVSFEKLLRHEYLAECRSDGGSKAAFDDFLKRPEIAARIREHYGPDVDVDALYRLKVLAQWQLPFPSADRAQLSFAGMAAPGGFRFRSPKAQPQDTDEAEEADAGWISVLSDYALCWQWQLSLAAKRDSIEVDMAALAKETKQFQACLDNVGGNLFAMIRDGSDPEAGLLAAPA